METFPELDRIVAGGAALQAIEPAVAPALWGCRVGIGYPVVPGASTYGYATIAERRGVRIRAGRAATLARRDDAVVGVVVDGRTIPADAVLVAAGPWSPAVIDPSGVWRPIRERWGVVVETDLPTGPTHVLEEAEIGAAIGTRTELPPDGEADLVDFSLVPLDGVAAVGSTFLAREPDAAAWVERILSRASTFVPAVADAPIRGTRACARPQSLDGRPLIGRVPDTSGLFICAGHGAWGISTGPGLGSPRRRPDPRTPAVHPARARSRPVRDGQAGATTMTSSRRGPWTPSTRWSSMSLVADGPLIHVCGRVGFEPAERLGHAPDDPVGRDDADVQVGQEAERPPALAGTGVEDDRAGLGDGDRAVGDDAVDRVEVGRRQRRVVADAGPRPQRSSQVRRDARRDGEPPRRPWPPGPRR